VATGQPAPLLLIRIDLSATGCPAGRWVSHGRTYFLGSVGLRVFVRYEIRQRIRRLDHRTRRIDRQGVGISRCGRISRGWQVRGRGHTKSMPIGALIYAAARRAEPGRPAQRALPGCWAGPRRTPGPVVDLGRRRAYRAGESSCKIIAQCWSSSWINSWEPTPCGSTLGSGLHFEPQPSEASGADEPLDAQSSEYLPWVGQAARVSMRQLRAYSSTPPGTPGGCAYGLMQKQSGAAHSGKCQAIGCPHLAHREGVLRVITGNIKQRPPPDRGRGGVHIDGPRSRRR
jgi:hypothetical protein